MIPGLRSLSRDMEAVEPEQVVRARSQLEHHRTIYDCGIQLMSPLTCSLYKYIVTHGILYYTCTFLLYYTYLSYYSLPSNS